MRAIHLATHRQTQGDLFEPYAQALISRSARQVCVVIELAREGYGFIQPDDGRTDVFIHISALERAGIHSLSGGQKVSFDTERDRRIGKMAVANIQAQ